MNGPFVSVDVEGNEHYYPEAIIAFLAVVVFGCIMGGLMAVGVYALVTGAVF